MCPPPEVEPADGIRVIITKELNNAYQKNGDPPTGMEQL